MPVPTVIGIDYDGVLADTNSAKSDWIHANLGIPVPPWRCDRSSCVPLIGIEAYETMGAVVYERDWTHRASPVPGALEALATLARWATVQVVTARLPHRVVYARDWLADHGALSHVHGITSSHGTTKANRCTELGIHVLVDDDARHLVRLPPSGPRPILLRHGCPDLPRLPPDVVLCRSWDEVLGALGDL